MKKRAIAARMVPKTRRNGKIDLLRFVYCVAVIILHIEGALYEGMKSWGIFSLAHRGYIGVEFFFLVSGWLLAKKLASLDHVPCESDSLGGETYRFLWNKLRPIIPYHIIFCICMIGLWAVCYSGKTFLNIFAVRFPSIFFLHRIGIGGATPKDVLGIEWYIFSMLLSMSFLYPLGRRFGKTFRCLAPITGMLICGWLIIKTGCLGNAYQVLGVTYKCNWRALGELLMGMGCYEATCALNKKEFTKLGRAGLAALEMVCHLSVLYYAFGIMSDQFDMYALCLLAVGITISFSNQGVAAGSRIFNNDLCSWLGKVSMPIYLAQAPWLAFLPVFWKNGTNRQLIATILLGSVFTGIFTQVIVEWIGKCRTQKEK